MEDDPARFEPLSHKTEQIPGDVPEHHDFERRGRLKRDQQSRSLLRSVLHHRTRKPFGPTPENSRNALSLTGVMEPFRDRRIGAT
ncbi:hypothetical protein B0G83_1233 [Paraburkholderia sp. BL21I4N1]|nr:hypothetical protein B0G83_1233 [Paraburkholderia sp. BL21I4N1]